MASISTRLASARRPAPEPPVSSTTEHPFHLASARGGPVHAYFRHCAIQEPWAHSTASLPGKLEPQGREEGGRQCLAEQGGAGSDRRGGGAGVGRAYHHRCGL